MTDYTESGKLGRASKGKRLSAAGLGAATIVMSLLGLAAAPAVASTPPRPMPSQPTGPAFNEAGLASLAAATSMTGQAQAMFERAAQMAVSPSGRTQAKSVYSAGLNMWKSAQARAASARAEHAAASRGKPSSPAWTSNLSRYTAVDMAAKSSEARARAALAKNIK